MKSLGEKISPILEEIEITLLENYETPPKFPIEGFRAGLYIFQSVLMDKLWERGLPLEESTVLAENLGKELKEIVFKYAEINTVKL